MKIMSESVNKDITSYPPGSTSLVTTFGKMGRLSYKNWSYGVTPHWEEIGSENFMKNYNVQNKSCSACKRACSHFYEVKEGEFSGLRGGGLEYENIAAQGPLVGHTNLPAILEINNLCNCYGLDVITAGAAIANAIDWFERGIITERDTGGLVLKWGDVNTQIDLIHKIVKREGFGNILAEGPYRAAKIIGRGAEYSVVHIKGMDTNMSELRFRPVFALGHATSTRGADHLRGMPVIVNFPDDSEEIFGDRDIGKKPEKFGIAVAWTQNLFAVIDSITQCKTAETASYAAPWRYGRPENLAKLLSAATGLEIDRKGIMEMGERIYTLEYCYNVKLGCTRKDDIPPKIWFEQPMKGGKLEGSVLNREEFEMMKDKYYEHRGWDVETGIPTSNKLKELGLDGVDKDFQAMKTNGLLGNYAKYVVLGE
jgi:aldehyde:ferredoxin oxidoreductase